MTCHCPILICTVSQVKELEDALVAELCPTEDGARLASKTGLLLQRLEGCMPAEDEYTSAYPLQVAHELNPTAIAVSCL